jgi:hypothetical protein
MQVFLLAYPAKQAMDCGHDSQERGPNKPNLLLVLNEKGNNLHLLAQCSYSKAVWAGLASWSGTPLQRYRRFKSWWVSMTGPGAPATNGATQCVIYMPGIYGKNGVDVCSTTRPCLIRRSRPLSGTTLSSGKRPGVTL